MTLTDADLLKLQYATRSKDLPFGLDVELIRYHLNRLPDAILPYVENVIYHLPDPRRIAPPISETDAPVGSGL
jgi:hypothetical protein